MHARFGGDVAGARLPWRLLGWEQSDARPDSAKTIVCAGSLGHSPHHAIDHGPRLRGSRPSCGRECDRQRGNDQSQDLLGVSDSSRVLYARPQRPFAARRIPEPPIRIRETSDSNRADRSFGSAPPIRHKTRSVSALVQSRSVLDADPLDDAMMTVSTKHNVTPSGKSRRRGAAQ